MDSNQYQHAASSIFDRLDAARPQGAVPFQAVSGPTFAPLAWHDPAQPLPSTSVAPRPPRGPGH